MVKKNGRISGAVAVVFGLGPAGLFLCRKLAKAGYRVLAIARNDDIGQYSSSIEGCCVATNCSTILSWLSSQLDATLVARGFVASDQYLTMILENRGAFEKLLEFKSPCLDILALLNEKEKANALMVECGMTLPPKEALSRELLNRLSSYPVAIKPQIKMLGEGEDIVGKVTVVYSRADLELLCDELERAEVLLSNYTCESYIRGDNSFEYGYGGFAEDGVMLADVAVRQFRQYPQGVACAVVEVIEREELEELRQQARLFIEHLNYSGFIQFDMKRDSETGELFVLDANPRVWGSVGVLARKYPNMEVLLCGRKDRLVKNPKQIYWHSPLKEVLSGKVAGNVAIRKPAGSKSVLDLYEKGDYKPFLAQLYIGFRKVMKRWQR